MSEIAPAVERPVESPELRIGELSLATRYFLAPLAGYTHLAFRQVIREHGGVGLATTDLVQAQMLVGGNRRALSLVETNAADRPLSVQIFGGVVDDLVAAARWLESRDYAAVDLNMGCPMAKITGNGGGARLMCDVDGACRLVGAVRDAVQIPVTVKMRLGWDGENITAPMLAREFEKLGVAAITVHGRTRQQGFHGSVQLDGIRQTVDAVHNIPVIGNGDVRSVADAIHMHSVTGCAAVAIGRGALMDPWIFRRLRLATNPDVASDAAATFQPTPGEQIRFLSRHFQLMVDQHGESQSCLMFRKFAAWYGARLGIPEDLEDRLRRFESIDEFEGITAELGRRHGTRKSPRPTIELKVPNGPIARW